MKQYKHVLDLGKIRTWDSFIFVLQWDMETTKKINTVKKKNDLLTLLIWKKSSIWSSKDRMSIKINGSFKPSVYNIPEVFEKFWGTQRILKTWDPHGSKGRMHPKQILFISVILFYSLYHSSEIFTREQKAHTHTKRLHSLTCGESQSLQDKDRNLQHILRL